MKNFNNEFLKNEKESLITISLILFQLIFAFIKFLIKILIKQTNKSNCRNVLKNPFIKIRISEFHFIHINIFHKGMTHPGSVDI